MKSSKKRGASEQSQADRFIEAARQLGADEDEDAFKRKLEKIAKAKPKDESKK